MKLHRRRFLKAAGVSLALPWLGAFAQERSAAARPRRRMVCLCTPLGLHPADFFPERTGRDYELTPYLEILREFRQVMDRHGVEFPEPLKVESKGKDWLQAWNQIWHW